MDIGDYLDLIGNASKEELSEKFKINDFYEIIVKDNVENIANFLTAKGYSLHSRPVDGYSIIDPSKNMLVRLFRGAHRMNRTSEYKEYDSTIRLHPWLNRDLKKEDYACIIVENLKVLGQYIKENNVRALFPFAYGVEEKVFH
jgi:hypothetical protein